MKQTDLEKVRKYRFFQEFDEPILYEPHDANTGETLLIYGIFPYHSVTLIGDKVTSHTRDEFADIEYYLNKNSKYFITNKYLIVGDKYCIYCHDAHARKGDYTNIKDYDYRQVRPIYKDETYPDWKKKFKLKNKWKI